MSSTDFHVLVPLSTLHDLSVGKVVTALATIFIIHFIATTIYNLYFHPLRNFPGPKFRAVSKLPHVISTFQGKQAKVIINLHLKYGSLVRVSPDALSINDPQAWKDVHGHATKGKANIIKHPKWYGQPINNVPSIITADDAGHARMRRIFAHAFSDKALKQQEVLFKTYVDLLVTKLNDALKEDPSHVFDIVRMYNFTTFDIMGDLTFGEPLYMLNNSSYVPWVSTIFESIRAGSRFGIVRNWALTQAIADFFFKKAMTRKRREHFDYSARRVDRRLERGSDQPDIWNLVMTAKEGKGLDREEMYSNASIFMLAGTETTATLLSGLTYYLLKNPNKMEKLVREIRGTFSTEDDITIEELQSLPYLHACLEEALRMYPPVPVGLPRLVPPEGAKICDQYIPGGVTVTVQQLAMYMDPKNFKEPESFIPERWTDDERFASDNKAALQPFSYGPRNCIGKNLAYHEMRLIAAKVLYNFDMILCPESDQWADQHTYTLWEKHPLMVKLTPAKSSG